MQVLRAGPDLLIVKLKYSTWLILATLPPASDSGIWHEDCPEPILSSHVNHVGGSTVWSLSLYLYLEDVNITVYPTWYNKYEL